MTPCRVEQCQSPARLGAYCWSHGARFEAHGDPLSTKRLLRCGDRLRLLSKLREDRETGCWNWTGFVDRDGYGRAKYAGGSHMAHRAAWLLFRGEIPAASLDHLCRNRKCCNPDHLEPVSMAVNTHRGDTLAANYAARDACFLGHEFTEENTYLAADGARVCKTCRRKRSRDYMRARRARLKAAVSKEAP